MGGALEWISQIADWIGKFFPRWQLLDLTQGAVKTEGFFLPSWLRRCKDETRVVACGPGLHWYWPATTRFEAHSTAFQTDNLPSQTIETADGHAVTVGGMISYRVADVAKLLTQCYSPVMAIRAVTLPTVHSVVCRMDWERLKDEQRKGTLDTKLRKATTARLAEFGIEVESVELTDMVRSRAFRLIQSTQQDDA